VHIARITQGALRELRLAHGGLRLVHVQVSVGQAEMRLAVIRLTLERGFKVGGGRLGAMEIVQDKAAIHIGSDHAWIALDGCGEVGERLIVLAVLLVHVAGEKGNVGLLRQHVHVLRRKLEEIVVVLQMEQVVAEVDDDIAIVRQRLDGLAAGSSGLAVVALEAEVALLLAQHLRLAGHFIGDAIEPVAGEREVVGLNGGVHAAGNDERILGSYLIALAVGHLRLCEFAARGVEIAEREIGNVKCGIGLLKPLEVFLSVLVAAGGAGSVAERGEGEAVGGIDGENALVSGDGVFRAAEFHEHVAIEL
jgi:hypothetical protein